MKFTKEQITFLKSFNGEKTYKELVKLFQVKYKIDSISLSYFRKCLRKVNIDYKYVKTNRGSFKRGFIPWNKGKKTGVKPRKYDKNGEVEWLEKPIGTESITKDGYTLIKTEAPTPCEYKQRIIWKRVNGEIPKGHVIIFADGDKTNFNLENLICVTKNELRQLNRYELKKDDADLTKVGIGIVKLKAKLYKIKKGEK